MPNRLLPLSGILQGILRQFGAEQDLTLYQITEDWEEIVGLQIAAHTQPDNIRQHTLYLLVDSAPWMNQLNFFKKEIAEKINLYVQKVLIKEIVLKRGLAPPLLKKEKQSPSTKVRNNPIARKSLYKEEEMLALNSQIESLSDEAIRKKIKEALVASTT
jgi:hypothetical protein